MAAFHRCLEEAGVPWHSVGFPSKGFLSTQQQSAEETTEDDVAVTDAAPTLPRDCGTSGSSSVGGRSSNGGGSSRNGGSSGNEGGGGASEEASASGGVSSSGVSLEGGSCLQHGVSRPGVLQSTSLRPKGVSQPPVVGSAALEADVERSAKEGALRMSPPLLGERGALINGGAGVVASLGAESGSGLWCHPGDLERVRFCVCGRGRGLVC